MHVVSVLIFYYSVKEMKAVIKHLHSFSVISVTSQSLYDELCQMFENFKLPWDNLISILG